jgi:hypothetical protein
MIRPTLINFERLSTIDLDVDIAQVSLRDVHRKTPIDTTAERGMTSCAPARNRPSRKQLTCHLVPRAMYNETFNCGQVRCNIDRSHLEFAPQTKTSRTLKRTETQIDTLRNAREHPRMPGSKPACEPL